MTDYQSKLFPYAYNILGSAADAYDAIQDVMVKQAAGFGTTPENESAYLIKAVINHAINIKKRNQRIRDQKTWLPEPVSTESADGPVNRKEIITYSMLVLLEHLNARERAVFILREAFDYSHEEIADTLSITIENSRKLLSRAKSNLKSFDAGTPLNFSETTDLMKRYVHCIETGNMDLLTALLTEQIAVKADGGTQMKVVSELTQGIGPVSDLMLYLYTKYQQQYRILPYAVNHQPALLFYEGDQLVNCQIFEWDPIGSRIKNIFSVVDPEKLLRLHQG